MLGEQMFRNTLAIGCVGIGVLGGTAASAAEDTITLRMAGFLPPTYNMVEHGSHVFMDKVTELTDGRVQWEYYPAQQIGKATEMVQLLENGVADIAEVSPTFHGDKLPLSGLIELPGLVQDACDTAAAFHAVGDVGGVVYDADFAPIGIRPLSYFMMPGFSIHSRDPIRALADFKGKKLRPTGGVQEMSLDKLDAVGIKIPGIESFNSLTRGTIDGVMMSFFGAQDFELETATDYSLTGYPMGAGAIFVMVSDKTFEALPADVQAAMVDAGRYAEDNLCRYLDAQEAVSRDVFRASGSEIVEVSPEMRDALDVALAPVANDWTAQVDGRGKPASEALAAYEAALRAGQ
ncbi:TRAP transporter substrate-binding protein DctP [Salipiger sp. P9]|uniref:TRAP transporter substrate-binding protein DctP n=1 Tax=Salipiger pentaromativorans TaxID=2943193 RepID=UPI00215893A6|nr:TRAP transporter substrate-binding protein DctP [Salipiger pentaromativorans]MCR8551111.1 TRAP transporter substrate-binding protein DctP [Salipiger pentaromativorans]